MPFTCSARGMKKTPGYWPWDRPPALTDFGAVGSAPVKKGKLTPVDTWAGRGGFGSKLFQEHGLVGIIYGGTHIDEDFRDRAVADQWFQDKFNQKMAAKDMAVTTKYRYDPKLTTGGTFRCQLRRHGRRYPGLQLPHHPLGPGSAQGPSPTVYPGSLPQTVQRGDHSDQTAAHLRRTLRSCL